jgi:hypothetical protein
MAIRKKNVKKLSKNRSNAGKGAKKTARRPTAARLSAEDKLRKVRPGDDLNEFVSDVMNAWGLVTRTVRVPEVSLPKLRSMLNKSTAARTKESAFEAKMAAKLAPLSDARLIADDAVYRAALTVKRVADALSETDTAVAEAFSKVTERFRQRAAPRPAADDVSNPADA